ncbi:MAG: hypothetical protein DRP74_00705 [Candidatus Omnitrophota bacterium]|nr:MAG: hypothetical protein DRP74_00705 [Candidatus Omnitrophota bacterium]
MALTKNRLPVGDWLTGAIKPNQVNVGTTPTPLPTTALNHRRSIIVYNNGSNTVYLGDANVTVGNGLPMPPGGSYSFKLDVGVVLYGVVASGTEDVRILEGS